MKKIYLLLVLLFLSGLVQAQKPYFQQEVAYAIDVTLDDQRHMLLGTENMLYINKSPDALDRLYIHLWPNAYRDNKTAFARQQLNNRSWKFFNAPDSLRGFIDSLDFQIEGKKVRWEYLHPDTPDVAVIWLDQPLQPGAKLNLSTPFRVKIPGDFSRLGHDGQQYQITQWYPKPAVYDRNGWHYMPYLDLGEFYSEYGSFEVTIRVPANYRVAASGNLQNAEEKVWLDSLAAAAATMDSFPDIENVASSTTMKALRYNLDNVHDFAWFAGKDYYVKKSQIQLPKSGRAVTTWAFFTGGKSANYWKKAATYVDSSVYLYSLWVGEYPYEVCTAVEGALSAGGGMEYPTVTVISAGGSAKELDLIVAHEVGHNWFYGILGSNERDYPWLDEGINSYYEARYMKERYGKDAALSINLGIGDEISLREMDMDQLTWLLSARRSKDVALWETPSHDYDGETYGTLVYKKTAVQMAYLAAYLGQEEFDSRMQAYFQQWKFKHPQPADFEAALSNGKGGKPTKWWFDQQLKSSNWVDYRIRRVKKIDENNYSVRIAGLGNPGPFTLSALDDSGTAIRREWFAGFEGQQTMTVNVTGARSFVIDQEGDVPLYMRARASAKVGQWWPAIPQIKFVGVNLAKNKAYLLPALGANTSDGFMAGLLLHSALFLPQDLEYAIAPMYGFGSETLAGSARIRYNWHMHSGPFARIQAGFTARRYDELSYRGGLLQYYATARLRKTNSSTVEHDFRFRLSQRLVNGDQELIPQFTYELENYRLRNRWSVKADALLWAPIGTHSFYTASATRLSAEATYRWDIWPKGKMYWENRVFAGYSPATNGAPRALNSLNSVDGAADYTGDAVFFDRSGNGSAFWGRQIMSRDARMRVAQGAYTDLFSSLARIEWQLAWNTDIKIPKTPLLLFADVATSNLHGQAMPVVFTDINGNTIATPNLESVSYAAGISFDLFNGGLRINAPLVFSRDLKESALTNTKLGIGEQINFTIDLIKLIPHDLVREFKM